MTRKRGRGATIAARQRKHRCPGMLFYSEIERGYSPDEYGAILLSIYLKLLFTDDFLPGATSRCRYRLTALLTQLDITFH